MPILRDLQLSRENLARDISELWRCNATTQQSELMGVEVPSTASELPFSRMGVEVPSTASEVPFFWIGLTVLHRFGMVFSERGQYLIGGEELGN